MGALEKDQIALQRISPWLPNPSGPHKTLQSSAPHSGVMFYRYERIRKTELVHKTSGASACRRVGVAKK